MTRSYRLVPALRSIGAALGLGCLFAAFFQNDPVLVLPGFAMLLATRDIHTRSVDRLNYVKRSTPKHL